MSRLDPIIAAARARVARRRRETPLAELELAVTRRAAAGDVRPFRDAIARPGLALIAEHKRRSPSAGAIREDLGLEEVVQAYERGGAAALSILTEDTSFGGSLDDLRAARRATGLPLLRKDFIVDPYQVHEAFAAGADAILLIVAALTPRELSELHAGARELGLSALVEVHDEHELEHALALGADIVGINNRDLKDFSVDVERTPRLVAMIPPGVAVVSESGIGSPRQLAELERHGVHAVLVGESLMRAPDPAAALAALKSFSAPDGNV